MKKNFIGHCRNIIAGESSRKVGSCRLCTTPGGIIVRNIATINRIIVVGQLVHLLQIRSARCGGNHSSRIHGSTRGRKERYNVRSMLGKRSAAVVIDSRFVGTRSKLDIFAIAWIHVASGIGDGIGLEISVVVSVVVAQEKLVEIVRIGGMLNSLFV